MKILLLGSGGREHAFAYFISQSEQCEQLFIAPGNAGTSDCGINVTLDLNDFNGIWDFCVAQGISLLVPGNEDPLVAGITDFIEEKSVNSEFKIQVAGPSKYASQLEGSKDFSKVFMSKYGIPTASFRSFTRENVEDADAYIEEMETPIVLKADGLAAGKGVIIIDDKQEAKATLKEMILDLKFGKSSEKVVIEEFLKGIEISVFVVSDGVNYKILGSAKDYKRIGEGDLGLNTGGMGAISPVPFADDVFMSKVSKRIIEPTLKGLREEGNPFKGFLFLGLMNDAGDPKVIEYNVRMGDPETEAIFPRLKTDMVSLLMAISTGTLDALNFSLDERTAATVFLVSRGYPGAIEKGFEIHIPDTVLMGSTFLFHAGVISDNEILRTHGGRVTAITVLANDLKEAIKLVQQKAESITFEGKYFRKDIGKDLLVYAH